MKDRITGAIFFLAISSLASFSCQRDEVPGPSLREANTENPGPPNSADSRSETAFEIDPLAKVQLVTPANEVIQAELAHTPGDQRDGLSGVAPEDFGLDEGKLFFYLSEARRTFWMPDTYFDLDVFYLDENLRVTEVVRDLRHHPGRTGEIPRAPAIRSRHVLELRSDSRIGDGLKVGDLLRWESPLTLRQTESKIRQLR